MKESKTLSITTSNPVDRTFTERLRRRKHEALERQVRDQIERELVADRRLDELISSFDVLPRDRQRQYARSLAALIREHMILA